VEDAFKKLVEGGEAELTWMILNREEETLHLEFEIENIEARRNRVASYVHDARWQGDAGKSDAARSVSFGSIRSNCSLS